MTEQESYDLNAHIRTDRGMRLFGPLTTGIMLIVMGAKTLLIGAVAIAIGVGVTLYGLRRHMNTTRESKTPRN